MQCKKCNSEITNEAKYCPVCGNILNTTNHLSCPRCNNLIAKNDRFCKNCGFDIKNNKVSSFEILNKFNLLKLSNYKAFSSILMLVSSILAIICLFLPIFNANYTPEGRNLDLFKTILSQEINVNGIKIINLPNIMKMLFSELTTKKASIMTYAMANHMGLFSYSILSVLLISIGIIYLIIIAFSIYGIIKKTFNAWIKKLLVASFTISLFLFVGMQADGIGTYLLVFIAAIDFVYLCFMEIISKENIFKPKKLIIKGILLFIMTVLLVSLLQGSDYTSFVFENRIPRFEYNGKYISGIISQLFLKMMFISDSRYSMSMTTSLTWMTSVVLSLSIIFLIILCYSYARLLLSFSNENIEIPTKEIIISFVLFVAFFIFEFVFADYLNVLEYRLAVSEELSYFDMQKTSASAYKIFFIKKSLMFSGLVYVLTTIYSIIAKIFYFRVNNKYGG